ncbi:unnamed protein product [Rotaria sp. Silwood1]|nr:unnamed protein product [Rotaria sp. Silwood1]CAF1409458.1 unnamed protein product [Rotaria sp. Silwood1]CAF3574813.1 unnamed protein product [Rotaria sp. Silwood1]
MANGMKKPFSTVLTRQIPHIRLHDDGNIETRYEILNKLGEGSFGTVSRVKNKENDLFYALKTITKKPGNKSKASILDNEVKLLTEVNHANLIQLHEVLESSQKLYLVVELCEGGELGGCVKKIGPLPEETVKQIMSKLISALHYLHKMNIVHRDLKLENILLKNSPINKTDEFDIRVTDFGLSSKQSITSTDSLFYDYCGTPLYMAPEILENKNYSALCDVWAMGVIMYYLICGRHPYVSNDERRLLEIIRSQKLRFDSEKFRNISSEGLDFLQGMLVYDTVHRRTMGELIVHPWLTGRSDREPAKDIITMMREFQAENDQRQILVENNLTRLINATANHVNLSTSSSSSSTTTTPNKQQESINNDSNQSKTNINTSDLRTIVDKNKLHNNTITHRLTSNSLKIFRGTTQNINGNLLKTPMRSKQCDSITDLTDSSQSRLTFNSPSFVSSSTISSKLRANNVRLGRSQSHADIVLSSKYSSPPRQQQYQRTVLNGSNPIGALPSSNIFNSSSNGNTISTIPKGPPSSTTTALMMINKHYSNNSSSSSFPTMSNHHQQHYNTKKNNFLSTIMMKLNALIVSMIALLFFGMIVEKTAAGDCDGSRCGCYKGYCWAYVYEGRVRVGDWWCYTQRGGVMGKRSVWQECCSDSDCFWHRTCGNHVQYKGEEEEYRTVC